MPITVFVADDHAIVRDGLVNLLSSQPDIRVVGSASDGLETVREVAKLQPAVVVMDIAMPRMNGIEAAREICSRAAQTRIVILSMHSSVEHVYQALGAGAQGYVLKRAAAREIVDAVRAVSVGHRYLSHEIAEAIAEGIGRGAVASPLESLSRRERQILQLVAEGHSGAQIAQTLHLSPKQVDTYRSRLMHKLRIGDTAGLVKFAIQHGLTALE